MRPSLPLFLFFLFSGTGFASETLIFSERDSSSFYDLAVILPHVKTEVVTENGRELVVHTRAAQTSDLLASLVCVEKQFTGQRVSIQCSASIDSTIQPSAGNRLQTGLSGILRATISEASDLRTLGSTFRNAGACQPSVQTRLFATDEKRKITFPNGRESWLPLVSVNCLGSSGTLTQLVINLVPREN